MTFPRKTFRARARASSIVIVACDSSFLSAALAESEVRATLSQLPRSEARICGYTTQDDKAPKIRPHVVIYENECGQQRCVSAQARYVRELQLRAAWPLRAGRAHGDARPQDDGARRHDDEWPLRDDAHAPDALVTVPSLLAPYSRLNRHSPCETRFRDQSIRHCKDFIDQQRSPTARCSRLLARFPDLQRDADMTAPGPRLPTWALQQVGGCPGYTGGDANIVAKAACDPFPTFTDDALQKRVVLAVSLGAKRAHIYAALRRKPIIDRNK